MLTNPQILAAYKTAESAIRKTCARYGWTPSADDIADLQQATCLKVVSLYDETRGEIGAMAWRVAMNETTDYLRGRTSAGAIKRNGNEDSLTGTDDDGHVTTLDIEDTSGNARDMLELRELNAEMASAFASISPSQRDAWEAEFADVTLSGSQRIAKMRSIEALQDSVKASSFVRSNGKARKPTKSPKVEAEIEADDPPGLVRLRTLSMWDYQGPRMRLTVSHAAGDEHPAEA